jgi:hypothetical protein
VTVHTVDEVDDLIRRGLLGIGHCLLPLRGFRDGVERTISVDHDPWTSYTEAGNVVYAAHGTTPRLTRRHRPSRR